MFQSRANKHGKQRAIATHSDQIKRSMSQNGALGYICSAGFQIMCFPFFLFWEQEYVLKWSYFCLPIVLERIWVGMYVCLMAVVKWK